MDTFSFIYLFLCELTCISSGDKVDVHNKWQTVAGRNMIEILQSNLRK